MDKQNRKRQHANEEEEDDYSIAGSEWTMNLEEEEGTTSNGTFGNGNDTINKERMATLKAEVQMLKAELKCAKMEAKMRDKSLERKLQESQQKMEKQSMEMTKKMEEFQEDFAKKLAKLEENQKINLNFVKEKNKAISEELKVAKEANQKNQQKLEEIGKEMAILKGTNQKLTEKNVDFGKKLKVVEQKLKESIQANQQKTEQFEKEMVIQKEQQRNSQIRLNNLWTLAKGKKLPTPIVNPKGNNWKVAENTNSITISTDGLTVNAIINNSNSIRWQSVSARKGFHISADSSGPIIYYFEVDKMQLSYQYIRMVVGLSSGNIPDDSYVGSEPNSFAIEDSCDHYKLSGKSHTFEWQNGAIKPKLNDQGNVLGCGMLLNSENQMSIFFTLNGILIGKQIPIDSTANALYPTVSMCHSMSVEANFGGDSAKPFKYDIKKCPGMVFK